MSQNPMMPRVEAIALEHPVTLATYGRYAEAQRAVDYLSDQLFPVENCMIVGTDLRQLERVTGRMTQQKAAVGGLLSGAWLGIFVGLIMSMFDGQGTRTIVTTVLFGALFGVVWALIGYAMTRGRRDFTSVSSVVATRYEVLVEHAHLARAREVLSGLPNNGLARSPQPGSQPQTPAAAPQEAAPQPAAVQPPAAPQQAPAPASWQQPADQEHPASSEPTQAVPEPSADATQVIPTEQRPGWEQPQQDTQQGGRGSTSARSREPFDQER